MIHFPSEAEMIARDARQRAMDAEGRVIAAEARLAAIREKCGRELAHLGMANHAMRQEWADLLWRQWIEAKELAGGES